MNTIVGVIEEIKTRGSLSLVTISAEEIQLTAIVIDTPETTTYLKIGGPIKAIFKETEVIIAKGDSLEISLQNRIAGTVTKIESGELLSKIVMQTDVGIITSIITTKAVEQLTLTEGSSVTALIKTNEIMLSE